MRILLVEDDKNLSEILKKGLKEEYYAVDIACDGVKGDYLAAINFYDIIIMDIRLPKMDGYELCKKLRSEKNNTPILMLTANDSIDQKVQGLDSGADDYLTKPFDFEELLARLRALTRRKFLHTDISILKIADLTLNFASHEVTRNNEKIELTSLEIRLLKYFMLNHNVVLSRTQIGEHVWDMNFDKDSNVIDVYINYLRNKIDKNSSIKLIHTIRGAGYIMRENKNENTK